MGYYEAKFSAYKLHFPARCCCCGVANPGTFYTARHTRVTGVRVVRHDHRHWRFPLCGECADWINAVQAIPGSHDHTVYAICAVAFGFVAGVGALMIFAAISAKKSPALGFACMLPSLGFVALLVFATWTQAEKRRKLIARRRREADLICPTNATDHEPVEYLNRYGTIHTFGFTCKRFFDEFVTMNRSKLVY